MSLRSCAAGVLNSFPPSMRATVSVLAVAAAIAAIPARTLSIGPLPLRLQDTGLYSDWQSKTVASRNLAYSPQYPLWSDGAGKTRWMKIGRAHV